MAFSTIQYINPLSQKTCLHDAWVIDCLFEVLCRGRKGEDGREVQGVGEEIPEKDSWRREGRERCERSKE